MSSKTVIKSELFDCTTYHLEHYQCQQCPSFKTNFLTTLRHHVQGGHAQQNTSEVAYKCLKCPFVTHSKYFSIKHRKFDNCISKDQQKIGKNGPKKLFACKVLEVAKHSPNGVGKYESFLNELLTIQFSKDTKKYYTASSHSSDFKPEVHTELYAPVTYVDKNQDNLLKCEQCNYRASQKFHLQQHKLRKHTPEDQIHWFNCEQCDYKATRKTHLQQHKLRKHTPEDQIHWLSCEYCAYKCSVKTSLRKHLLSKHALDGRVQWLHCDHCSYKTVEETSLNKHIICKHAPKNAAGIIQCEYCAYETSVQRNLRAHIKIKHTPEDQIQWFCCEYCQYKSVQKGHLQAHVIARHMPQLGPARFSCEHCDYKTAQRTKLQRHSEAKHAHLLRCGFCNYLSSDEFLLNLHVSLRHRSEEQS